MRSAGKIALTAASALLAGTALAQGTQSAPPKAPEPPKAQTPAAKPEKAPAGTPERTKAAAKDVKAVQEALKAKGYDPGPIDGMVGPKTSAALKAFQKSEKLQETGRLDSDTRSKLGI